MTSSCRVSMSGLTALAFACLALLGATAASAAAKPVPAFLTDVARDGQAITGVLTVRGASADVNSAALVGTLGGRPVQLTIDPIARTPRRTMLVVDTSGSMGEEGMQVARTAAGSFLTAAPKDVLIGVVSFANTAGVDVPLTGDRARLQASINALESKGETSLYAAVQVAVKTLGTSGERSIILLSDGGDTMATNKVKAQTNAVAALRTAGIRAEIVAFNTDETDTSVLDEFAAAGGGSVAQASNSKAVGAAFAAAARVLDGQVRWRLSPPEGLSGKQSLIIQGAAGDSPFSATSQVDLGALRATATPTDTVDSLPTVVSADLGAFRGAGLSWWLPVALVALSIGVFGLVAGTLAPAFETRRSLRVAAVEAYLPASSRRRAATNDRQQAAIATSLVGLGEKVMEGRKSTSRTMTLIQRADLPLRPGEWFVLRIVGVVLGGVAGLLLVGGTSTLVGLAVGLLAGYVLPAGILRFLARRRARKFEQQIPDALALVASSLGAGFSLSQALDAVAKDSAEPLSKEMSRALAEARLGDDIGNALERMAVRMDSENMRWTAMSIRIQREVGGNLSETLRTTVKTVREREGLRRQVRALSAEGRLSGYILISIPIVMFLYMFFVRRDYISVLWQEPLGVVLLFVGGVAMIVGTVWMSKVVKVEV